MARDMDLIRKIILMCDAFEPDEEDPSKYMPPIPVIEGYSEAKVCYHIHLMGQAGLLDVCRHDAGSTSLPQAMVLSVTWKGHEFADAAKENKTWIATKGFVKEAGNASFDFTLEVLKSVAKQQLQTLTGMSF